MTNDSNCTGRHYPINVDDPTEGVDIRHDEPCPEHPDVQPHRDVLWRWAEGIMNGSGASTRSAHRAAPRLHILDENHLMWCSSGQGQPFVSIRADYCPTCLALARDMWEDLNECVRQVGRADVPPATGQEDPAARTRAEPSE